MQNFQCLSQFHLLLHRVISKKAYVNLFPHRALVPNKHPTRAFHFPLPTRASPGDPSISLRACRRWRTSVTKPVRGGPWVIFFHFLCLYFFVVFFWSFIFAVFFFLFCSCGGFRSTPCKVLFQGPYPFGDSDGFFVGLSSSHPYGSHWSRCFGVTSVLFDLFFAITPRVGFIFFPATF